MTSLYASIIRLNALHPGQLSRDAGQWANAVFYGILNQVDPFLAEALHQWNGRKPFTISSLRGLPRVEGAFIDVQAGCECWLRVTTLGEEIFQPFIQHFLEGGARPRVRIGPVAFNVCEVLTTPGSDGWAGFTDAGQLAGSEAPERLALAFASPTAFNLGTLPGKSASFALFPDPSLVFGSLASKWRDFISPDMDVECVEDFASGIRVSDYRLQTQTLQWRGRVQKGFTGRCFYDLRQLAPFERQMMAGLANFAFYAGVGGKTGQGMGQCRRMAL